MMDNPLGDVGKGRRSQITTAERQNAFLCIPANARIRECRLESSASVEATLPMVSADVTLALALFNFDFRVNSRLKSLESRKIQL